MLGLHWDNGKYMEATIMGLGFRVPGCKSQRPRAMPAADLNQIKEDD